MLGIRFSHLRWTGTLAVVGGAFGLVGTLTISVGYFGTGSLRGAWLLALPWLVIMVFGFLVRFLRGARSAGASLGLAVLGAVVVGPVFVSAAGRLRWIDDPGLWPTPIGFSTNVSDSAAEWLLRGGLVLVVIAAFLVGISCWIPVARTTTIPGSQMPRSPYRIEVLALVFVLVLVALSTSTSDLTFFGTYASVAQLAILLSWIVPLSLVLGLSLRSNGLGSLWVAAGLGIAVVAEPVVRSIGLAVFSGLNWTDAADSWYQESVFAVGNGLISTAANGWIILPSIVIIVVIALWNASGSLVEGPSSRETPISAPLDPWAGTAFVLAFIPLISVPALALGHISYERVVASDKPLRGRVLAATAIVLSLFNIAAVVLIATGAVSVFNDIWIGG